MRVKMGIAAVVVLVLIGCVDMPVERTATSSNAAVKVSQITTFDGCTLYFVDGLADNVYVARCPYAHTTAVRKYQVCNPCGKSTCCHAAETRAELHDLTPMTPEMEAR